MSEGNDPIPRLGSATTAPKDEVKRRRQAQPRPHAGRQMLPMTAEFARRKGPASA